MKPAITPFADSRLTITAAAVVVSLSGGPAGAQCRFQDVASELGLAAYRGRSGDFHGPGGVFADLDEDGFPDLYLASAAPDPANRLFRNVDGGGTTGRRFERAPDDAGAGDLGNATGAIAGDYDNDGDLDLYVLNFDQPNALLRNLWSDARVFAFVDATAQTDPTPGVDDGQHGVGIAYHEGVPLDNSLTAAWADVDRDGDLDLYVGNHNGYAGGPVEGPYHVPGRRDVFYRNEGDGTFTDVTMTYGVTGYVSETGEHETVYQHFSSTNAVIFADFDNDRWPDLLVTNKIGGATDRDMLYMNRGVNELGAWRGFDMVTYALSPTFGRQSGAAMGVDVADVDHDGDLDLYITDWSDDENPEAPGANDMLFNQLAETGTLGFVHSSRARAKYSWGTQWQDFDNDGRQELHVATNLPFRDYFYANITSGITEYAVTAGLGAVRNARGAMTADYNRDGWIDLFVVTRDDDAPHLYENRAADSNPGRHYVSIRLHGDPNGPGPLRSTRDAIGGRVRLAADTNGDGTIVGAEHQMREVVSGSSLAASTSSLELEFGLGLARRAEIEVLWPDGARTGLVTGVDRFLRIDQAVHRPADLDASGTVDAADLLPIFHRWGPCGPAPALCPADIDDNGVVDVADLNVVIADWG